MLDTTMMADPTPPDLAFSPDFSVRGQNALLTGAGRGIGLAMAKVLAAHGAAVAVQDIDLAIAREAAELINGHAGVRRAGGRAIALDGDITDLDVAVRLPLRVVKELGGLDILVNNAAVQLARHFQLTPLPEIERQVRADFIAPVLLCQQIAQHLRVRRWGRIINLGSIQQLRGNAEMLPYAMCKAAIENLTRGLARDLAPDGITVNCLAPGWIDTYRNRDDFKDAADKAEKGRRHIPLGRIGEPADLAGVTLLLCSRAGEYITGQTIYVDGGMSVR